MRSGPRHGSWTAGQRRPGRQRGVSRWFPRAPGGRQGSVTSGCICIRREKREDSRKPPQQIRPLPVPDPVSGQRSCRQVEW